MSYTNAKRPSTFVVEKKVAARADFDCRHPSLAFDEPNEMITRAQHVSSLCQAMHDGVEDEVVTQSLKKDNIQIIVKVLLLK